MRTIAIGDIHGCLKAVRALVEWIDPKEGDTLVFLGDYVDRGPDSRGTIEYLIEIRSKYHCVFLRGNHEILFGDCVLHGKDTALWFHNGGRTTLTSYGGRVESVPQSHREFIASCIPYYETEDHFFIHANYIPHLPLNQQPEFVLYWEHLHERLPSAHVNGKTGWLGHSPQLNGWIADFDHFVCIDTYCFGNMYLTAIDVDSREVWQTNKLGNPRYHRSPVIGLIKRIMSMIRRWKQRSRSQRSREAQAEAIAEAAALLQRDE